MPNISALISPTGLVNLTGVQTITNKTLVQPGLNSPTISGTVPGNATFSGNITFTNPISATVTGTTSIANGGTGGANGTDARKLINRSAYLGISSATTLEAGKIYGVWTGGGSYTCTLPSAATAVVGDVIECVDYNLSSNTWAINNWTLGCPANTYINNLAESMTIDVTGRITITCTYSDGTNKYWNVTLG